LHVLRLTLLLAAIAASGCDLAFQIDHVQEISAPCGPYAGSREITVTGVSRPRMFSINAGEQLALVMGEDEQGRTRPIPLQWNGEAWEPNPMLQTGLDTLGIVGAHLAPAEEIPEGGAYTGPIQPAMNGWTVNLNRQQVSRFYWTGSAWSADNLQTPLFDSEYDTRAGNVVVVRASADPADRVRHAVLSKTAVDIENPALILLAANSPPSFSLIPKPDRTRPLDEQAITLGITLGDAVMTDDQAKLVYSAVSGGQSDIYATAQSPLRDFAPGGLIASVTTQHDEVEPWIDGTCSKLYFRRIPAGSPNDPGQIFVAE
jgi:hypothetical protein